MLRKNQKLGKYRILGRLANGPYAVVYEGLDTILGLKVALKLPHPGLTDKRFLEEFRKEARLASQLDHDNILPVKDASFIDGQFVISMPLGDATVADRLGKRISTDQVLDFSGQMISAVAHAHSYSIIHCDIKPENFILFPGGVLKLADFGIAKVALRTLKASGSGTIGYLAPEQALGRPSYRSDVFSLGLIIHRMLTGQLPEWPFDWPLPGYDKLRKRVSPQMIAFLKKSLEMRPKKRFKDAEQMLAAFERVRRHAKRAPRKARKRVSNANGKSWREIRFRQFRREYGRALEAHFDCSHCGGPVSESMQGCPWCGKRTKFLDGQTRFPSQCPRCKRGTKLDWSYCAWCYGGGFADVSKRLYSDKRYTTKCGNCREPLMPFMRYCPWCRSKVRRKWPIPGAGQRCRSCGWGVVGEYWSHCPWCKGSLGRAR